LTAENGYFKNQIIEMFEDLGYSVSCEVLRAEDFGVPQIRRRAIFVGSKKTVPPADLPKGTGERVSVREAIDDLPELLSGEGSDSIEYPGISTSRYQEELRAQSTSIRNHISTNHSKIALQRLKLIPPGGSKADLPPEHQTKSIHSGTWSRINPNGFARTITTRFDTPSSGQFTLPYQDRCLTVREAARIQSFPDTFVFYGSKTCQMLQVGNAVPPKLSKAIALEIQKAISRN
jgi:site-specific DNA-cytosine methylase